jgi:hypothetical protein
VTDRDERNRPLVQVAEPHLVSGEQGQEGGGCAAFILVVLVIGAVVAAVISIAALVDPFSWLPPVGEIWEDCEEKYDTPGDDCELATRFPGSSPHVIANFAYVITAVGLLAWLAYAVVEVRRARVERYLAVTNAVPAWTRTRNWTKALLAFKIHFGDRLPD